MHFSPKTLVLCFISAIFCLTTVSAIANTRHAVVVGVTAYPYLDSSLALVGPGNDAQLVYKFLQSRNFDPQNINLLAENQTTAKSPTRSNILAALEQIVNRAERGDFVYLHFSGHGSQQPANSESDSEELDGLDEIFLPADAKQWNSSIGKVENAITDNEIDAYMTKIRQKGAFIWAVFDSCHSGTMTRGNPAVVMRKVDPKLLGIPQAALAKVRHNLVKKRGGNDSKLPFIQATEDKSLGGYVAFFAAQTNEETPEMRLPRRGKGKKSYGLFTYSLMQVLNSHPGISYQQVAEQILQTYAQHPWNRSTPLFAGTHLNTPIFGTQTSATLRQWKLDKKNGELKIAAGLLHNLTNDSILAILPSPTATIAQSLGYVSVIEAANLSSFLQPITYTPPDVPKAQQAEKTIAAPRIEDIPKEAFVRLVQNRISLQLTLGIVPNDKLSIEQAKVGDSVIAQLRKTGVSPLDIVWIAEKDSSHIRVFNAGDKLLLIADYEELPCPFGPCTKAANNRKFISISLQQSPDEITAQLASNLRTIAKTINLMRLSSYMGGNGELSLKSAIHVQRKQTGESKTLTPAMMPKLFAGDKLSLSIENASEQAQDITVLFIDSGYGISLIYPDGGRSNRFQPGNRKTVKLGTINVKTTGPERLIVLSSAATRNSPASNFAFLAQQSLARTRGVIGRGPTTNLKYLLEEVGFGRPNAPIATRGMTAPQEDTLDSGSMMIFNWITSKAKP